ncbi:hypothetical protein AAG570_010313 [Ranatra chinensis]|uniref:Uncharacterized protein n=1 Tax=Ranatra chinensis TaxID=642074 RepID=A0ABD0YY92_9HEMI
MALSDPKRGKNEGDIKRYLRPIGPVVLRSPTVDQAEEGVRAPKHVLREQEAGDDGNCWGDKMEEAILGGDQGVCVSSIRMEGLRGGYCRMIAGGLKGEKPCPGLLSPVVVEFVCRDCGAQGMTERTVWPHVASCRRRVAGGPPRLGMVARPRPGAGRSARGPPPPWLCPNCARALARVASSDTFCPRCRGLFESPTQAQSHRCFDCFQCAQRLLDLGPPDHCAKSTCDVVTS